MLLRATRLGDCARLVCLQLTSALGPVEEVVVTCGNRSMFREQSTMYFSRRVISFRTSKTREFAPSLTVGFLPGYDAFAASRIIRSNVPGATLRKRVLRLSETAMLIVGLWPVKLNPPSMRMLYISLTCSGPPASRKIIFLA